LPTKPSKEEGSVWAFLFLDHFFLLFLIKQMDANPPRTKYYEERQSKITRLANEDPVFEMALILGLNGEEHNRDAALSTLVCFNRIELALELARAEPMLEFCGNWKNAIETQTHHNIHVLLQASLDQNNMEGLATFTPLLRDWLSSTTTIYAYGYEAGFLTEARERQWKHIKDAEAILEKNKSS
jgi:hypothetical protein